MRLNQRLCLSLVLNVELAGRGKLLEDVCNPRWLENRR